ncbi:zinc-binding dehydrogenase [Nocardioides daphniae]|uniref:Alcohol dehydrogenase-like C-terminal domain-containing protein n=1 Tax=Nocardioides daphniae TaxID=402297 RepID=A0A4P7UFT9_9ACTN|nr:zinc-binding dehydrogenase [Nocardioides daphniae]QCC78714.1 hypothetical protein E2C04_09445 [Nocardioides daphniae]
MEHDLREEHRYAGRARRVDHAGRAGASGLKTATLVGERRLGAEVGAQLASGELVMPEDRTIGLEHAGAAFAAMMSGANVGKVVVEVAVR